MSPFFAAIPWSVDPIIGHLGPLTFRWYGVLFMSGFLIGLYILNHIYRAERVSPRWVDSLFVYILIGTILGARLGHVLFYAPDYYLTAAHWVEIFKIWEGGLASHGATIGILFAAWLFARNNKFDYLWVLDRLVLVVATGGACIRLGNLMNSEIIGSKTTVPWGFQFLRYNELHGTTGNIPNELHHASQLYEGLFCVVLFAFLYAIWNRYKERTPRGLIFGLFVVLLFTQRFLIEFIKLNQEAFEDKLPLNMGQILSIPLIFLGIWVLLRAGKNPNNPYGYAPRDLGEEEAAAGKVAAPRKG